MKKLMSSAVLVAMLASACGSGSTGGVAATVGGSELTVEDVRAFPFTEEGSLPADTFAQYLGALIQWQILDNAASEEFGIDPTADEIAEELDNILLVQAGGATAEDVAEQQNLSIDTLNRLARVGLVQQRVADELGKAAEPPTEDDVAAELAEAAASLTTVCVRHLLVATHEEAEDAIARIEGGEDFGEVAAEVSTDPSAADNGGDLDCAEAGRYVIPFRDAAVAAEIDAITGPVQSEFGLHVLQVYDRTEPAADDLPSEDEIIEQLSQQAGSLALQDWLTEKINGAEVSVGDEFGTWVTDPQPMVQPPQS